MTATKEKKKSTKKKSAKKTEAKKTELEQPKALGREILHLYKEEVKPYWRNPRENDETIPLLISSIEKYGFNVPLVVDANYEIIAGHARHIALTRMEYEERIPCMVVSDLSDEKVKEYRIADNKVQEASKWNQEELFLELRDLPSVDDMQEFFLDVDLGEMFKETAGATVPEVTTGDIEKATQNLGTQGKSTVKKVTVTCPHCGEDFDMQK